MELVGLLIVFILTLVALNKIGKLERQVAQLAALLPKDATPQALAPAAEIATPEPVGELPMAVAPETAEPVAPIVVEEAPSPVLSEPETKRDVEQTVASRWFVWVGGIAIAVGGILFVKYAVDNDLLSPAMRCAIGLIFGVILILAGEFLRRRSVAGKTYVPGALTAAGLVIAFGSIYAAHSFYGLIDATTAFAGLAITALLAFALSLVQGPLIAALGLIGSYVTPAIIPSPEPSAVAFFPYLFVILAASFAILRRRPWWWLGAAAIYGAFGWSLLWIWPGSGVYEPADLIPIGIFALALGVLPARMLTRSDATQPFVWTEFLGFVAAFLLLIGLIIRDSHSTNSLLFLAATALAAVAFAWRREGLAGLAPMAMILSLAALTTWNPVSFSSLAYDELGTYVWVPGPEADRFLHWIGVFAAFFILIAYLGMCIKQRAVLWAWTGLGTVLAYGFIAYGRAPDALSDWNWMLIAGGLALLHVIGIFFARKRADEPKFNTALGLLSIAATALAAFALYKRFQGIDLTLAWSALVPLIALAALRLPVKLLGVIASTVAAVVTLRLLAAREIWFDVSGLWLGPHFVLYAYGVPALLFWISSRFFARAQHPRTSIALEGAALGLAIALISLELRVLIAGSVTTGETGLLEISAHALAWLGAAIGLMHRDRTNDSPVALVGSRLLIIAASAVLVFGALGTMNPVITEDPIAGSLIFNTLILAYLLPALLLAVITKRLDRIGWGGAKPLFGGLALLLALAYLTLQTKRFFQGPDMVIEALSDAENYAYSAVWLAFALVLLIAGIWRSQQYLRYAGLIVAALVVLKVFLLDMSGLSGLYRIASFIGLGLCLVGIGYLYARFVQPRDADKGVIAETVPQ